jgi:hypothetical protein
LAPKNRKSKEKHFILLMIPHEGTGEKINNEIMLPSAMDDWKNSA